MNPIIKFATLFGLLAVELAEQLKHKGYTTACLILTVVFLLAGLTFVFRSFHCMRIKLDPAIESSSTATPQTRKPEHSGRAT